jgi:hypothetical protein
MAPGIRLVPALTNAIATVAIGAGGNMTAFQAGPGRECVGREGGTAESKRDRKNDYGPTQHELGIHHKLLSSAARATVVHQRAQGQTVATFARLEKRGPVRRNCSNQSRSRILAPG